MGVRVNLSRERDHRCENDIKNVKRLAINILPVMTRHVQPGHAYRIEMNRK
jgi:hypothetical protein